MKKNKTGISNILRLLTLLQKKGLTQDEIQEKSDIKKQTFYKYMKYFKDAGFDIRKSENKFTINRYSKNICLDSCDINLIANIRLMCENILCYKEANKVQEIIDKILLMSDSNTYKQVQKRFSVFKKSDNFGEYKTKINLFENFLNKNILVEVTIKSKNKFRAKPYKIAFRKNRIYFIFITEEGKVKTILADKIIDIQADNLIKPGSINKEETIFEIYDNLAKTYMLREDEILLHSFKNGIRIASMQKDKNLLFKRLLRYDTLCKIIYPKSDKIKFKQLIDTALSNISGV